MKLAGDTAVSVQVLNNNPLLLDWFNVKASLLDTDSMYTTDRRSFFTRAV